MKKKNIIIIALLLFLSLIVGSVLLHPASPTVKKVEDTLTFQQNVETTLKSKLNQTAYSFDNPFIEINPYGNSPLTALVAFTTPKATSVSITIKGKDEKSTFYHEFSENTEHLIPIYGLYPDTTNEIILRLEQTNEEHLLSLYRLIHCHLISSRHHISLSILILLTMSCTFLLHHQRVIPLPTTSMEMFVGI